MLKHGIYGKYKNIEYKVTSDMDNNIYIMTRDKNKIDETFSTNSSGVFEKIVKPNELSECIRIIPYGNINGEKVRILQEQEDQYLVGTGSLIIGTKLKLPRIDRDDWRGWVLKNDITLIEKKSPINPFDLV